MTDAPPTIGTEGDYLMTPSHLINADIPRENIEAFFQLNAMDAIRAYSKKNKETLGRRSGNFNDAPAEPPSQGSSRLDEASGIAWRAGRLQAQANRSRGTLLPRFEIPIHRGQSETLSMSKYSVNPVLGCRLKPVLQTLNTAFGLFGVQALDWRTGFTEYLRP